MKIFKLITFALLMSFSINAQIEVITSDITNFWTAFDSVQTTQDVAKQTEFIQKLYLDKASFGLTYTINFQETNAEKWVEMIGNNWQNPPETAANTDKGRDNNLTLVVK